MAYAMRPTLKVTLTVADKAGTSTSSFHIGAVDILGTATLPDPNNAAFQAFLFEYASSLQNAVDTRVTDISLAYTYLNDTLAAFSGDPNTERKGVLQFLTADGFYTTVTLPGIKSSAIGADGVNIIRDANTAGSFTGNPLETHLESVHDKLRNGVTIGAVTYPVTDRRGADVRDLVDAYQQHRANSRG